MPEDPPVIRQALGRCAVIYFIKCFDRTSKARSELSADRIYEGEPPAAMEAFKYFHDLRRKHFVHDENAYAQSLPGAVLNAGTKDYKVEKIVCLNVLGETLEQGNFGNLKLLISKARAWVIAEFDRLCDTLTMELESEIYQQLLAREDLSFRVPTLDELSKTRKGVGK